ncbi:hypothetical protein LUZ61_020150 [Rhynchospora tenuis]|uniref:Uncharacterized protein n=1 Tax=Rhynchospora tenuis TaxID=198213 RepID=A0AAD5ZCF3_9POAL|nr:hypothetical protein LUZ61_020150 [Rhynchospora tenuis]
MDGIIPIVPATVLLLDLSSNHFSQWPSPFTFRVSYLLLSNNRLTGDIPISICHTNLLLLDLSYNHLNGTMPPCLYGSTAALLQIINLKSNNLSGTFPRYITNRCALRTLILSGNKINGSLPQWLVNCTDLEVLDLANNEIRNTFPYFLGNLQNLRVLVLRSNQFYGTISNMEMNNMINDSIFPMLQVFDVSSNSLIGTWPKNFFGFLKAMVKNSDTRNQTISYQYEYSYYHDSVTVTFKGRDMDIRNSLGIFNSLDLSNNGFWGEIPEEIGQLKSLDLLNLSHNAFTGLIPCQLTNLEQLESLDLSFNRLSGHIPQVLTSLTFLETLNLSYNNLVGEIPQANQFLTYKNDSYLGNPGLCGIPLTVQCRAPPLYHGMNEPPSKSSSTDDIPIGLSISIGVGFAVGFASIIWVLVSWENGRKWLYFKVDRLYFMHFYR